MATFQDFSLVNKVIKSVRNRNKIEEMSYAFIFTFLEKMFPIDPDEYITDGGGDFSIDAYYIDFEKEEINIFQLKYTDKFEIAKTKIALKQRDISLLIQHLEKIWAQDKNLLKKANPKVNNAVKNIWDAFEKGFFKTNIWLISNYNSTIEHQQIEEVRFQLQQKFRADLKIYSLEDLVSLLITERFNPVNISLQLKGRNYFEDTTGEARALIGEINALNFLKSILRDDGNLEENIFNENIRVYLKQSTKINKQIYSSIQDEKENYKFFFYNNGITAICDSYKHPNTDSPIVNLENFQIVNGGQTVHSIYDAYKHGLVDNIKNIYLLIRIYEVKDRAIGQTIARYTNTQNPVKTRDIMSNDQVQIKLQEELKRLNWWYERKKYEFRDEKGIKEEKKIDAEKLGQVILSFYLEMPGSAKNKKQEIFGNFYNQIFNEDKISAEYVLLPYLLYKEIEKDFKRFNLKIKKLRINNKLEQLGKILAKDEFLLYAHYYLLLCLKLLAEKKSIDLKLENKKEIFRNYKESKKLLRKIIERKKNDPKFSLSYVFKSDDLVKELKKELK
ncbi:MAG: AIPR family protein [Candidatus Pacebacteria bacterium]|nr:AIPR family protein [Candidatus Paceibacterota bacterium]